MWYLLVLVCDWTGSIRIDALLASSASASLGWTVRGCRCTDADRVRFNDLSPSRLLLLLSGPYTFVVCRRRSCIALVTFYFLVSSASLEWTVYFRRCVDIGRVPL